MAGFADGLQAGFGLVNSAYDRKSKEAYRDESLAQDKLNADRTFGLAQEKSRRENITLEIEGEKNEREIKKFETDQATSKQQIENDKVVNAAKLALIRKQDAAVNAAQSELDATQATREKRERGVRAGVAATELHDMNPQTKEEFDAAFIKIQKVATDETLGANFIDSLLTLAQFEDRSTLNAIKGLTEGAEITSGVFESGLESLISGSSWGRVGATITAETHPNAPERMHGMEVVGSEIFSMEMGKDNTVSAQVAVRVQDGRGRMAIYLAPLSEKRAGDTQPINLNVEDLIKGFAGRAQFMEYMKANKPAIMEAIKRSQYRTEAGDLDTNAYATAVAKTKADEIKSIADRGMGNDPIVRGASVTWEEFMKTEDFDRYVEEKTLIPDRRADSARDETAFLIQEMSETSEIRKINKRRAAAGREPLSQADLLQASVYFDENSNGALTAERSSAWNTWKDKMSGGPRNGGMNMNQFSSLANYKP